MERINRHNARVIAVQTLYSLDFNDALRSGDRATLFECEDSEEVKLDEELRNYALFLVNGTLEALDTIDKTISEYSKNRSLSQIDMVDRNILRVGLYELMYNKKLPSSIVIDECVKLSQDLSNDVSYKFINGILDSYRRDQNDPAQR